jgi:chemotaxis protein CheC
MLSELEKDLLIEIMNTNIGRAASLLSEMVDQRVILSVPKLDIRKGSEIDFTSAHPFGENAESFGTSVLSTMQFGRDFSGNAYILFPSDKARCLIDACTGEQSGECGEAQGTDIRKMSYEDIDVLKEISNVIFNAVLGEFGNLLHVRLEYSFPEVEIAVLNQGESDFLPEDMFFLSMFTSFLLSKSQVRGMIFIALSLNSEKMLLDKIDEMLVDVDDGTH